MNLHAMPVSEIPNVIDRLKGMWVRKETTEANYLDLLEQVEKSQLWRYYPPGRPYGSAPAFFAGEGIPDRKAFKRWKKRTDLARLAQTIIPARPRGWPPGSSETEDDGEQLVGESSRRPPSKTEALLARVARDAPEVLERVKAGEFETLGQIAKAAGMKAQSPSIALGPVNAPGSEPTADRLARQLHQQYQDPGFIIELASKLLMPYMGGEGCPVCERPHADESLAQAN